MSLRCFVFGLAMLWAFSPRAGADAPVPASVLNPGSAAEAWNVLRLVVANLETLIREERPGELTSQASLCSPSLRALENHPGAGAQAQALPGQAAAARNSVVEIAVAGKARDLQRAAAAVQALKQTLAAMGSGYEPAVTGADIFICPMHPDFISENPAIPCHRCGMRLMTRRIPASFIYTTPGEPSLRMEAQADAPLTPGRKTTVRMKLATRDGKPMTPQDLVMTHTQPIHLLIVDSTLGDYHHEHPLPVNRLGEPIVPVRSLDGTLCGDSPGVPGEYVFSFTPRLPGPYRIWADLVPTASGLQEYVFADLPGTAPAGPAMAPKESFSARVDGLDFQLTLLGNQQRAPRAKQVQYLTITVADAAGQPVQQLEPLMQAFAHLVGFYGDQRTVLHFHPDGGEILREEARGGPVLTFRIYPPKPGFLRLYCQVKVAGREVFAPFTLRVVD